MTARLEGHVAIVTGAGQGIGRGAALQLARAGAAVALAGRTASKLEVVAAEVEAEGGRALALPTDVTDRAQVDHLVATTVEAFGRVDVLVNSAQGFVFRTLEEATDDDIDLAYRSGVLGSLATMQACLPHLRARGGSIVNFGTSSAITGEPTFGPYAMAKEAIRALTRVAASEWGPHGIRVNCICPTAATPPYLAFEAANPDAAHQMAAARPLGRIGDPEADIGAAVVALASEDLRYLTGATLMLNGGRVYL